MTHEKLRFELRFDLFSFQEEFDFSHFESTKFGKIAVISYL